MRYKRLAMLSTGLLLAMGGMAAGGGAPAALAADTSPPQITPNVMGTLGNNGWYVSPVTVSWNVQDPESGIASSNGCGTTVLSTDTLSTTLTCSATNGAGLSNSQSVTVKIDVTAPKVTATPTTNPTAQGWYNHDVTFSWACSDATSGVATPCPPNTTLKGEGTGIAMTIPIADNAGNVNMATTAPINIDRTAPITSISSIPAGWSRTGVSITLTPTDNLSGVATTYYKIDGGPIKQGTTFSITTDGAHQIQYASLDNAGNLEQTHTVSLKIDQTPPTITHLITPTPNANHWNNTNVTVSFQCSDATSGVAVCPAGTTLTSEGAGQMVSGTATDNAGNSATDNVTVNIDKTPPTISGAPTTAANANGWYHTPVVIHWTCSDALSGIKTCSADTTLSGEGKNQSATGSAMDAAGNTTSTSVSGMNIDLIPPTLTAATTVNGNQFVLGPNTWTAGPVLVTFSCSDALSGVDTFTSPVTVSADGKNQSVTGTCIDKAGNTTTLKVSNINIDRTPPTLNPTVTPNPAILNGAATASAGATDTASGVASQSCGAVDTSAVGTKQVSCTATDVAGNTATGAASYVVAYGQQLLYNQTVTSGGEILFRVQLVDANNLIVSSSAIAVKALGIFNSSGKSVFTFTRPTMSYVQNYGYYIPFFTTGLAPGQYSLEFTAGADPTTHVAPFTVL